MRPLIRSRASLMFILITVFIDVLGLGLALPIIPRLVRSLVGEDVGQGSLVYGLLLSVYSVMLFVFQPVMGGLSDRFGRRPVILIALGGLAVDYVLLSVAPSVWWLVLGRVVSGIFGATYTPAAAYVADVTPPEKRAANFGLLGVAFGFGFIAGPVLGGLIGEIDVRLPFIVCAGLTTLNLLFGLVAMPESLAPEQRRPLRLEQMNPVGAFRALGKFELVVRLLPMFIVAQLAKQGVLSVWVPYTTYRLGWTLAEVGASLAIVGVVSVITQGVLVRLAVSRFGEARTMVVSLLATVAGMLLFGLATQGVTMYVAIAVYATGLGLLQPAVLGLMSRGVPRGEQGLLQGAMASLVTATAVVAPPLMNGIFALFIRPDAGIVIPGAAFFAMSVLGLVALGLTPRRLVFGLAKAATAP